MTRGRVQVLLSLCLLPLAVAFESDFSFYPQRALPCLNSASKASRCSRASVKDLNTCLCGSGGNFIIQAAQCLGEQDKADVQSVYSTMAEACAHSGTPMTISQQDFFDAAAGKVQTTSSVVTRTAEPTGRATATETATTTSSATPGSSGKSASTGLSKGAVAGIAVGAAAVGVLGTAALVMFYLRRRRQQTGAESHPMLGQGDYYRNAPTTFPPSEPLPDLTGRYAADQKPAWGVSPPPTPNSPQTSPVAHSGHPPQAVVSPPRSALRNSGYPSEMHGGRMGQTFELDGSSAPAPAQAQLAVEMEGSQPARHSRVYQQMF